MKNNLSDNKKETILEVAKNLFLHKGIDSVSMNEIAKEAKIGKSTIYSYFKNKDDIVLELYKIVSKLQIEEAKVLIPQRKNIKDKIKALFHYYFEQNQKEFIKLYSDFYNVCIKSYNNDTDLFNKYDYNEVFEIIEDILNDGIKNKEIIFTDSKKLAKSISASIDGLFFYSILMKNYDVEYEIDNYLDTLLKALKN